MSAVLQSAGFRLWKYWLENIYTDMYGARLALHITVAQQKAPHSTYLKFSEHSKREI